MGGIIKLNSNDRRKGGIKNHKINMLGLDAIEMRLPRCNPTFHTHQIRQPHFGKNSMRRD